MEGRAFELANKNGIFWLKFSFLGERGMFLSQTNNPSVVSNAWDHLYFGNTPAHRPRPNNKGMLNLSPKVPTELAKKTYEPRNLAQNTESSSFCTTASVDMMYCKFWSFDVNRKHVDTTY